jgi:hypothetical protein
MKSNWTTEELENISDLEFASVHIRNTIEMLSSNSGIAQKLNLAAWLIDKLSTYGKTFESIKGNLAREYDREMTMEDIKGVIENESVDLDLCGMTPEEVLADDELLDAIYAKFDKFGCGDDYWVSMDLAIEEEIKQKYKKEGE